MAAKCCFPMLMTLNDHTRMFYYIILILLQTSHKFLSYTIDYCLDTAMDTGLGTHRKNISTCSSFVTRIRDKIIIQGQINSL
jgi:hypothetical protein